MDKKIIPILAIVVMTLTFFVSDVHAKCDLMKRLSPCCKTCLNTWDLCRQNAGNPAEQKACNETQRACEHNCPF